MKKLLTKLIYSSFLLSFILIPLIPKHVLLASSHCTKGDPGEGIKFSVCSPLAFDNFQDFLVAILNIIIIIATPIVVLAIVYAGFLYVTARGNVEQTSQATRALTYAIIGGILIIGALALTQIISNLVGAFTA